MKTRFKYKIGDWVTTSTAQILDYVDNNRVLIPIKKEIHGQVCGVVRKQTGKYFGGGPMDDDGDREPACLYDTKTVYLYEVRDGLLNKPHLCLESELRPALITRDGLPTIKQNQPPHDTRARAAYRESALAMPRDAKGRFIKV